MKEISFKIKRLVISFEHWWNSPNCSESLEKANVEECVLAWADANEIDLEDNLDDVCEAIVDYGIL